MQENTKVMPEECGGEKPTLSQGTMNQQPAPGIQPPQQGGAEAQSPQGQGYEQPASVQGMYQPAQGQPVYGQPVYGMAPPAYQPYQQPVSPQGMYQQAPPMQGYQQPEPQGMYQQVPPQQGGIETQAPQGQPYYQMYPEQGGYQSVAPMQGQGGEAGGAASFSQVPSQASEPKHDAHKYGQVLGLVEELVNGNSPDPSRIMSVLEGVDSRFWKGALVGVGAALLLTNDSVRHAIVGGFSTMFGTNKAEAVKEPSKD